MLKRWRKHNLLWLFCLGHNFVLEKRGER
ncbi:hypothetical protein NC652_016569 [Populus alba x Populus x berolinensis]|uniref:Uncharacterized protein n=1 Tax=Populus alba x Populus x berolinensis TaxID=444605 RepID=A0AAD6VZQ6_9ROSI|nr:hypothetical protein NC652_016569 [Populus alba x Populus x berolinensis]KAJ6993394.1 hypothetical protein NC653_016507 [Populus alba x Populus x berolinensis]